MQIVSQAVFQRLKQSPLLYTASHNRLAYVTSNELVVREIAMNPIYSCLRIRGRDIVGLSLDNPHYIAIVYRQGVLEIRRIEALQQLILSATGIMIIDNKFKIRVTMDAVYILCANFVQKVPFSQEKQRQQIHLSEKQNDYAEDMVISSILQQEKILMFQFPNVISFEIEGLPIARLLFERIHSIKLLRDPLLVGNAEMKEYIVIVDLNKWLKIYDVVSLRQILQMELFLQEHEAIQIKVDPLHEYVMLRIYDHQSNKTIRNSLLKINKEYYLRQSIEPFFLFDIEVGLKEDLILFPTHLEVINGSQFHSIDMCFFTNEHIKIATLVVDINHRTRLYHTKHMDPNWGPIEHWNEIISNLRCEEPQSHSKEKKLPELENKNESDFEWNKFIKQFWYENLQKFQSEGYVFNFDKANDQVQRCIEYPSKHPMKDNLEMEDALNTLSGSSSFRSSGEAIYNEEMLLKMIEGVDLSMQSEKKGKYSDASVNVQQPLDRSDSEISETDQYLLDVEENFGEIFKPLDEKISKIRDQLGRIEDVHTKKLKKMERNIRQHQKEASKLKEKIPSWCDEQMSLFASEIKDSLNQFNATVTRLEIMGTRRIKKLKKGFRDYVDEQLEVRQQKAEKNEQSTSKKFQNLMRQFELK